MATRCRDAGLAAATGSGLGAVRSAGQSETCSPPRSTAVLTIAVMLFWLDPAATDALGDLRRD